MTQIIKRMALGLKKGQNLLYFFILQYAKIIKIIIYSKVCCKGAMANNQKSALSLDKERTASQRQQILNNKKKTKKVTSRRSINVKISFFKAIPYIIWYARNTALKRVSRHQYQNLLFPQSQCHYKLQNLASEKEQHSIVKSLKNDYKQAKYPFYLTKCGLFIEDEYLNILKVDSPITSDFLGDKFGKIVCFSEYTNDNQQYIAKGENPLSDENNQKYTKKFWQQHLVLATDQNFVLVIDNKNKKMQYIKLEFKRVSEESSNKIECIRIISRYLFVFTSHEFCIVQYNISPNKKALNVYASNYFSKQKNVQFKLWHPIIINSRKSSKAESNDDCIFYVFAIKRVSYDIKTNTTQLPSGSKLFQLVVSRINPGVFSDIESEKILIEQHQPIINCKVKYCRKVIQATAVKQKQNCFITYTTKKNIYIHYYDFQNEQIKFSKVIQNPRVPPEKSKLLFISRIQYIDSLLQPQKVNAFNQQKDQISFSEYSSFSPRNSLNIENERYQTNDHIFVLVSYSERLYAFKLFLTKYEIEPAKRIKFKNKKIIEIINLSKGAFCLVSFIHDKTDFFNFGGSKMNQQQKQLFQRQDIRIFQVMVTLISKVVDFKHYIITQSIQKFTTFLALPQNNYPKSASFHVLANNDESRQLLILPHNSNSDRIFRVTIKNWNSVYCQMAKTQNIKLLKFLILSNNQGSPFFKKPNQQLYNSYKLQRVFRPKNQQQKMLLLEYYSEVGICPPLDNINLKKQPQLLIPFIINHSIINLEQETLQYMVQFWAQRDERFVEQLIVGGAESGWQLAVQRGWIRALRKMVQMGTQIDLPLLKLYSFILAEQEKKHQESFISSSKILKEQNSVLRKMKKQQQDQHAELRWLPLNSSKVSMAASATKDTTRISFYCMQIIQYSKLAFETFIKPPFHDSGKQQQLNLFYKALLNSHLFDLLIHFQPRKCLNLVSYIFLPQQKIKLIDQFDIRQFLHCNRQFNQLQIVNGHSISEMIFSHISASFIMISKKQAEVKKGEKQSIKQNNIKKGLNKSYFSIQIQQNSEQQGKDEQDISREQIKQRLMIQHARLFEQGIFQFKTGYKMQMLLLMVKNSNRALLELMKMKAKSSEQDHIDSEQDLQFRMQEFLENLWLSLAAQLTQKDVKQLMGSVEMLNSANHYLSIVMMRRLPVKDYSAKILKKYLQSPNKFIRRKVFGWIHEVLPELPDFQKQIIINLKQLIEIDKQLSRHLFNNYFASREIEIISRIDSDPILQLEYIELIIRDHYENQIELQQYYTNLHMSLLLSLEPERVIPVLEDTNSVGISSASSSSIRYNIAQVLKTTQEIQFDIENNMSISTHNKSGKRINSQSYKQQIARILSYLYEKMGQIQKSIQKKLELLESYLRSMIIGDQKLNHTTQDGDDYDSSQRSDSMDLNSEQLQVFAADSQSEEEGVNNSDSKKRASNLMLLISDKDKSKQVQYHLKTRFQDQFRDITQLIYRQQIIPYSYFYVLLQFSHQLINGIKHSRYTNKLQYAKLIRKQMGLVIVQMFQRGYSAFFVQWLNGDRIQQQYSRTILEQFLQKIKTQFGSTRSKLKTAQSVLNQMKKYLLHGYSKLHSQIQLLSNWTAIDINVLIQDIKVTQKKLSTGVYSLKKFCMICGKHFKDQSKKNSNGQQDQALIFNCGHVFHVYCIQQQNGKDFCWQCASKDKFKTMIQHQDIQLVQILGKYQQKKLIAQACKQVLGKELFIKLNLKDNKKQQQLKHKNQVKKRLNRLNLFDKRVSTLRTQAEIIDMRIAIDEYYSQQSK